MIKSHNEEVWLRCKNCGHKLLKVVDSNGAQIETKCHSCKTINIITINKETR